MGPLALLDKANVDADGRAPAANDLVDLARSAFQTVGVGVINTHRRTASDGHLLQQGHAIDLFC